MHPRLSRFACLLILATAAALPLSAQPGRSLTLGEALAEAERRSPELRASTAEVEAARARLTTAHARHQAAAELVEGEREQIEAAGELWRARIELELAVGGPAGAATGREEDDHVE
jgi:outer membrane protein TolC